MDPQPPPIPSPTPRPPQEGIQSSMGRIILPTPHNAYVGTATTYDMGGGLEGQTKLKVKSGSVRE